MRSRLAVLVLVFLAGACSASDRDLRSGDGGAAGDGGGCDAAMQSDPKNCGACGHDCLGGACSSGVCLPVTLASGQSFPRGIAVDATGVYWTNSVSSGTVMKVPLGGGTPTTLAPGQNAPFGIAVDATSVYWTTLGGGTVMKVPPSIAT